MERGFASASINPKVSLSSGFVGSSKDPTTGKIMPHIFRIRVPAGAHGIFVSRPGRSQTGALADEAEYILPRDTRFRIVQRTHEIVSGSGSYGGSYKISVTEVVVLRPDGSEY